MQKLQKGVSEKNLMLRFWEAGGCHKVPIDSSVEYRATDSPH